MVWFITFTLAVDEGNIKLIELLLECGIDIDIPDNNSQTSIVRAIKNSNEEIVNYLIRNGVDLNRNDIFNRTPCYYAIKKRKLETISIILNKLFDIPIKHEISITYYLDNEKIAKWFYDSYLVNEIEINKNDHFIHNEYNWFLLASAWCSPWELNCYSVELEHRSNFNINGAGMLGLSALHITAMMGRYKATKMLLKMDANLNVTDNRGLKPLDYAVSKNKCKVLELILLNKY